MNDELQELYRYSNLAELKKIELLLKAHSIQYLIQSYEDAAYDGIYTLSRGLGRIMIFKKDLPAALDLLKHEEIL